ncbi:MAG TPA: hypothetical protein VFY06_07615 [Verrucomicrobiae bacterium]|nr:hypothetical protein [Verrucomicrobiae bacterium]
MTKLHGAPASGTPAEFPVVYVLLLTNENGAISPVVYTKFDSEDMELDVRNLIGQHLIAPGSVLHFDSFATVERPTDVQLQSFKDFCKKVGITFVVSPTF